MSKLALFNCNWLNNFSVKVSDLGNINSCFLEDLNSACKVSALGLINHHSFNFAKASGNVMDILIKNMSHSILTRQIVVFLLAA